MYREPPAEHSDSSGDIRGVGARELVKNIDRAFALRCRHAATLLCLILGMGVERLH